MSVARASRRVRQVKAIFPNSFLFHELLVVWPQSAEGLSAGLDSLFPFAAVTM